MFLRLLTAVAAVLVLLQFAHPALAQQSPGPGRGVFVIKRETDQQVYVALVSSAEIQALVPFSLQSGNPPKWVTADPKKADRALSEILEVGPERGLAELAKTIKPPFKETTWHKWIAAALARQVGPAAVNLGSGTASSTSSTTLDVEVFENLGALDERLRGYSPPVKVAASSGRPPQPGGDPPPPAPWWKQPTLGWGLAIGILLGLLVKPILSKVRKGSASEPKPAVASATSTSDALAKGGATMSSLSQLAQAKKLVLNIASRVRSRFGSTDRHETLWLVAVFLNRLARSAVQADTKNEKLVYECLDVLNNAAGQRIGDSAWRNRVHRVLTDLFSSAEERDRTALSELLMDLQSEAVRMISGRDKKSQDQAAEIAKVVEMLRSKVPQSEFSPPPDLPQLLEAALDQILEEATSKGGRSDQPEWKEKATRVWPTLRKAVLQATKNADENQIKTVQHLFIVRDGEVANAVIGPLLDAADGDLRVNGELSDKFDEFHRFFGSLGVAARNTRFRIPLPVSIGNGPEPEGEGRSEDTHTHEGEKPGSPAGQPTKSPEPPERTELAVGIADFLDTIVPLIGYREDETEVQHLQHDDGKLLADLRELVAPIRKRLASVTISDPNTVGQWLRELEEKETRIGTLESQLQTLEQNILAGNESLQSLRAELEAKEKQLEENKKRLEIGGKQYQASQERVVELEQKLATATARQRQLEQAQSDSTGLERQKKQLEAERQRLATELQQATAARDQYSRDLSHSRAETARLAAENNAGVIALTRTQGLVTELQGEAARLEGEKEELKRALLERDQALVRSTAVSAAMIKVDKLAGSLKEAQGNFGTRYASVPDWVALPDRVSLLLNFSVLHLALATAAGDHTRRQAMLANLHTIVKSFQNVEKFPSVLRDLQEIEPQLETAGEGLNTSSATGPSGELFQQLLRAVSDHCPSLRPFRYHVVNDTVFLTD